MKKVLVLVLSLLLLTACGQKSAGEANSENQANVKTEEKETKYTNKKLSIEKLNVTYVTSPLNVPSIVEKQNKFFEENLGLPVNYAEITSGADQTQALASGDVDILYALGGSSAVSAYAGGADIKIINMYSRAPKAFCLYSKDDSIKSPQDLKGKTIAGPMGTNLHELLLAYLNTKNMTLKDVNFVNMAIPDALAGLENGSLDVGLLGGPAAYKAQEAGFHKVCDGEGLIEAIICVATSQKFYEEHHDVIEALEKAQDQVLSFMKDQPDKTKELVKNELKLDDNAYDTMYPQYNFDTKVSDKDVEGLQKTADFMFNSQMIKDKVDVKDMFIK